MSLTSDMFILLVEDQLHTQRLLGDLLRREFPGIIVHTATTVDEAHETLAASGRLGIRYRIAILDFKLPRSKGDQPETETDLRRHLLESTSSDAWVFHITAYPDDPEIQHYLMGVLQDPKGARPVMISKLDSSWPEKLLAILRPVVHGSRIELQTNQLFPLSPSDRPGFRPRARAISIADPTHELAALIRDVEKHWQYLDTELQARLRSIFHIEVEKDGTVVASLF